MATEATEDLLQRIRDLQARLEEAGETLRALRRGEVDAIVVSDPDGDRVYTLKGADEPYRLMVQTMAEGALTVTRNGLILFSNEQFASLIATPLERVIGSSIHDLITAEDTPMLTALLTGRNGAKAELRLKRASAALVPAQLSATTLRVDGTECVCLVVTDLTEQKRNQELVAAERLARSILDQAAGAILVLDPAGRIIRASRAAEQLANGTVLLRPFDDVFTLRSNAESKDYTFDEILSTARRHGSISGLEATARRPDGQTLDVLASASLLAGADSELLGCIVLLSDISGLRRVEEALAESEERSRLAQASAHVGVWEWRPQTGECSFTPELESLRGLPPGTMKTYQDWRDGVHPDDIAGFEAARDRAIAEHRPFDLEYRILHASGETRWISVKGGPTYADAGETVRVLGVDFDITNLNLALLGFAKLWAQAQAEIARRQQVELELRRSNEDLGQFAYVISHDLRSPLTTVAGFAEQLKADYQGKLGGEADTYISYITDAVERMRRLISELLAYSRVAGDSGGKVAPISSNEALRSAELNLQGRIHETRAVITHDPLPDVVGSSTLLAQLFQNLLENAMKFRGEKAPLIRVSVERGDQEWVFCVSDNGIGIDPKRIEQVFLIFKRLHSDQYEGTGIGLAICRKIVERHGGRIWADSGPGTGSKFYFTLPVRAVVGEQSSAR